MKNLGYHRPTTIEDACALLAQFGERARVMAGGTAFTIVLKEGLLDIDHIVSLERVPMDEVRWSNGVVTMGAMASQQMLAEHEIVRTRVPVLSEVLSQVASRRIRTAATIGGSLCWAEAASDPPGLLMALGAEVTVQSVRGRRRIAVRDLFRDYFTTSLAADEILTEVSLPAPAAGDGVSYIKFTPQSKADKPVLAVTALVRRGSRGCEHAAIVVGAAGPTPLGLPEVDAGLRGRSLDDAAAIERVAVSYAEAAQPVSDTRGSESYKRTMIRVLVRRALVQAAARAGSSNG